MSSLVFNVNDIFEVAKRIERNGMHYYQTAAGLMPDPESAKLMRQLAEMEVVHERIFAGMQEKLVGDELADTLYDPHDEAYSFLKGMADKYVFDPKEDPAGVLKKGASPETILSTALEREKDSVVFYEGVKVMVPQKFGGEKINDIIAQEMGHIMLLTRELTKVRAAR